MAKKIAVELTPAQLDFIYGLCLKAHCYEKDSGNPNSNTAKRIEATMQEIRDASKKGWTK